MFKILNLLLLNMNIRMMSISMLSWNMVIKLGYFVKESFSFTINAVVMFDLAFGGF